MTPKVIAEHVAALLVHLSWEGPEGRKTLFEDQVTELLLTRYNVELPQRFVEEALDILVDSKVGETLPSPLTSRLINIIYNRGDQYLGPEPDYAGMDAIARSDLDAERMRLKAAYPILKTYFSSSSEWIERVAQRLSEVDLAEIAQVSSLEAPPLRFEQDVGIRDEVTGADEFKKYLAPGADRLVPLDHNALEYQEVSRGLDELYAEVRSSNQIGESASERDRLVRTLSAARELWKATELTLLQVRVGIILAVADAGRALEKIGRETAWLLVIDSVKDYLKRLLGIEL